MKIAIYAAIALAIFGGGMATQRFVFTPKLNCNITIPPCPDCKCPPMMSVAPVDFDKIKTKRGDFHYNQTFDHVNVIMCNDSNMRNILLNPGK